jgi:hypothetical protein
MKYKLNQPIESIDGEPIRELDSRQAQRIITQCNEVLAEIADEDVQEKFKDTIPEKVMGEDLTYRKLIRRALLNYKKEDSPSQDDQLQRYDLLMKLAADKVDLESSEISLIRDVVAETYKHPIIIGRVRDLLEEKEGKKKKSKKKK